MKKQLCIGILCSLSILSSAAHADASVDSGGILDGSRALVAYFSAEGHTKAVAERIAKLTGADIYRIEPAS